MSNPFGGGIFIWIVSVVVAVICCDHICYFTHIEIVSYQIVKYVVSLLRQLLSLDYIVLQLDWLSFILMYCVVLY